MRIVNLFYQVAPAELEDILLQHPGVADVAVIGKPNMEAGELPLAFIVKKQNSDVTEDSIHSHLKGILETKSKLYISKVTFFLNYVRLTIVNKLTLILDKCTDIIIFQIELHPSSVLGEESSLWQKFLNHHQGKYYVGY